MAGAVALSLVVPISLAIVVLLAIVTFSCEQTIRAYPAMKKGRPRPLG